MPRGDARVRTKCEPQEFRTAAWLTFGALAVCAFAALRERSRTSSARAFAP